MQENRASPGWFLMAVSIFLSSSCISPRTYILLMFGTCQISPLLPLDLSDLSLLPILGSISSFYFLSLDLSELSTSCHWACQISTSCPWTCQISTSCPWNCQSLCFLPLDLSNFSTSSSWTCQISSLPALGPVGSLLPRVFFLLGKQKRLN